MSETITSTAHQEQLSRAVILRELDQFVRPSNLYGTALAVREHVLYWSAIALILFAPSVPLKIAGALFAGFRLSSSYTLAHDAAHRALVADRRLNWLLALLMGVPSCQNYRMWVADHNGGHHPKTNGEPVDFYRPLSKQEYDRLPRASQWLERFLRAPNLVGFWFNFMFRWLLPLRIHPTSATLPRNRSKARIYFWVMVVYHAALICFLAGMSTWTGMSPLAAVLLGWLLPLCVHCTLSGASLYLMHNHPDIPWFREGQDRTGFPPERCSTHLVLPKWISALVNNVYSHAAHHAHPAIPCYRLYEAQLHLNRLLGDRAVVQTMSLSNILTNMRICKLYDYERHQWLDFDGKPTAPPIAAQVNVNQPV